MLIKNDSGNIIGKLLIAMPGIDEPEFRNTVIYVCEHSPKGAMGLVINMRDDNTDFKDLAKKLNIPIGVQYCPIVIFEGGPTERSRGYVLHTDEYQADHGTQPIANGIALTYTTEILSDLAAGKGPYCYLFALGRVAWEANQLEDELKNNSWLVADADPDIVFSNDTHLKRTAALKQIGAEPHVLSWQSGNA